MPRPEPYIVDDEPMSSMIRLARTFPALRKAPGAGGPWDPTALAQWATAPTTPFAHRLAAAFVLEVWDSGRKWDTGPFLLYEAAKLWDQEHLAALAAWLKNPWFAGQATSAD
jgi:hypothetical protein